MQVEDDQVADSLGEDHRCPLVEHAREVLANRLPVVPLVLFALNQREVCPSPVNGLGEDRTENFIEKGLTRVVQLKGDSVVVQAELGVDIAGRLVDDFLKPRHLHQCVQMHHVEGEEADSLLVCKRSNDQRTSHADLQLEKLDVSRELHVLNQLEVLVFALRQAPIDDNLDDFELHQESLDSQRLEFVESQVAILNDEVEVEGLLTDKQLFGHKVMFLSAVDLDLKLGLVLGDQLLALQLAAQRALDRSFELSGHFRHDFLIAFFRQLAGHLPPIELSEPLVEHKQFVARLRKTLCAVDPVLVDDKWIAQLLREEGVRWLEAVLETDQVPETRSVPQTVSELAIDADEANGVLDLLRKDQRDLDNDTSRQPVSLYALFLQVPLVFRSHRGHHLKAWPRFHSRTESRCWPSRHSRRCFATNRLCLSALTNMS